MRVRVTALHNNPSTETLSKLRGATKLPLGEIRAGLIGEGVAIEYDYREEMIELAYDTWIEEISNRIDLIKSASQVMLIDCVYGGEIGTERVSEKMLKNILESSAQSYRQERD